MSWLAKYLQENGAEVTGSDANIGGHDVQNLPKGKCIVVINGAISDDNPEYIEAKKRALKIVDRAEILAQVSKEYKNVIAIAGTSGKSSTTALVGAIFREAGLCPTIHNGAFCVDSDSQTLIVSKGKEFFITEACEFRKSFLTLEPTASIITNISFDHIDSYVDLNDLKNTFQKFTKKAMIAIVNTDCTNSRDLLGNQTVAFGLHEIDTLTEYEGGKYEFSIDGVSIRLGVYGLHQVHNALAAIAVARHFDIDINVIKRALEGYRGIQRRFEVISDGEGTPTVITDYAHHPAEIATTVRTAKSLFGKYLIVFQPHTYTRTHALFNDFVSVFSGVDAVFYKTYSAREKPIKGGEASDLAKVLSKPYFDTADELLNHINKVSSNYDAIIYTGAGDIDALARKMR